MKILKIRAEGISLFKGTCEMDFTALQRVNADNAEKMHPIFTTGGQTYYQNSVTSFIGINASGKTTILRLISFVFRLLNNESINTFDNHGFFDKLTNKDVVTFDVYFFTSDGSIHLLHTTVCKNKEKLYIKDEYIKSKAASKVKKKADLFDFDGIEPNITRNNDNAFLLDDVSICIALNKANKDAIVFTDMIRYTDTNQLIVSEDCPAELIAFFDPSIEYLKINKTNKDPDIKLKFINDNEILLHNMSELNKYLSSGTIKGINIFVNAISIFKTGGYLIIDELENHFNHEIVSTLIRFFMNNAINPKGATLLFSTHYAELLDEFDRNDNIFIVRNINGITVDNLSELLKRNDLNKSDIYQSDYLKGTAPMYDAYIKLKSRLLSSAKEEA